MKLFLLLTLFLTSQTSMAMKWGVQIIDNKKTVRKFKPKDELAQFPLNNSIWSCYLSKTLETREGFARSIDCKYGKTKGMVSAKLFCPRAVPPKISQPKSTTFAVAEDQGEGFLFELRCLPNE